MKTIFDHIHYASEDAKNDPTHNPQTHAYIPMKYLNRVVLALGSVGIALGVYAIVSNLYRLPGWFPYLALGMLSITFITLYVGHVVIPRRGRRKYAAQ